MKKFIREKNERMENGVERGTGFGTIGQVASQIVAFGFKIELAF